MGRIKWSDLEALVERLNSESRRKYGLFGAYGGVQLVRYTNDKDTRNGVEILTPYLSKRELYHVLGAILQYLRMEKSEV